MKKESWLSEYRVWVLVVLIIILGILGSLFGRIKPATAPAAEEAVAAVTSDDLLAAYRHDASAADGVYKGKLLDVAGVFNSFGMDFVGTPSVLLKTKDTVGSIQCMLSPDLTTIGVAAQLSAGDILVLRGRLRSHPANIILDDCHIIQILKSTGK